MFPPTAPRTDRMSWWSRLLGGTSDSPPKPQRLDYLNEALALERQGDLDAALTSYRLALRDRPNDSRILQNMAIAYSRTGRLEDATRCYRRALEVDPSLSGAHYGLAFLLLKRGEPSGAEYHLEAFLAHPPGGTEAERWVRHAEATLDQIRNGDLGYGDEGAGSDGTGGRTATED
ncbi:MAG: tetratricopeptide repeat protein [Gemmatimonadaceae bacterium]